jgi:hypothetical protein
VTEQDIAADIHKDGARSFFSSNRFLDLLAGTPVDGLPYAGSRPVEDRLVIDCIRFAQKKRNSYLAVNALAGTSDLPLLQIGGNLGKTAVGRLNT